MENLVYLFDHIALIVFVDEDFLFVFEYLA